MLGSLLRGVATASRAPSTGASVLVRASSHVRPLPLASHLAAPCRSLVMTNVTKKNRFVLSVTPGNLPEAALKSYKPTSPSLRHRVIIDKSHLYELG